MPSNKRPIILFATDALCDYQRTLDYELDRLRGLFEEQEVKDDEGDFPPHIQERIKLLTTHPSWWEKLEVRDDTKTIYDSACQLGYHPLIVATHPNHDNNAGSMFHWIKRNFSHRDFTFVISPEMLHGEVFVDINARRIQEWQAQHKRGLAIMVATEENAKTYEEDRNLIRYDGSEATSFYNALSRRINKK